MLFVELAKILDDCLWHSGTVDNMPEVGLGYFDKLVVERVKERIESIAGSEGPIAWCH
jgi:hypothetical protein